MIWACLYCGRVYIVGVSTLNIFSDTSRPPRTGEVHGQHYYFATREEMRQKIRTSQFVEYEEHGGHYYGLLINTVRSVINHGKVALMTLTPKVRMYMYVSVLVHMYVLFIILVTETTSSKRRTESVCSFLYNSF